MKLNKLVEFDNERKIAIEKMADSQTLRHLTIKWLVESCIHQYSYNFTWMGRPIIQFPQDIVALQEIIWRVKPQLVIETGIAHGGSLIFSASILEMIGGDGKVIGIDVDIREHNRIEIENHPMFKRISLLQGSSTDSTIVSKVKEIAKDKSPILIILDSNHTHEHVLNELQLYAPFVTKDSYLVVFDTIIEDMPEDFFPDRPWGKGNNPRTAVWEFLKNNDRFEIDKAVENKLLITVAPDGYLKCVKD